MSQRAYTEQEKGLPGMKADSGFDDVVSRVAEGLTGVGRFVVLGTDVDKQAKLPAAAADITTLAKNLGVSLMSHAVESRLADEFTPSPAYADKELLSIMRQGRVLVKVEEAVTPESAVYVRFLKKRQVQTIVLDADLVAGNTIAGTLGGEAISVDFDTDHATTMGLLEAAVEAVAHIASATVGGAGNRTLTIVTDYEYEVDLGGDFAVTGGASQAGVVESETHVMKRDEARGSFRASADNNEAAAATAALVTAGKVKYMESGAAGSLVALQVAL